MTDKKIIQEIIYELNQVHQREDIKKQPDWTKEFYNALAKIGEKNGYKVYYTRHPIEWLFDLCWSIEPNENTFKGLKLICECEWDKVSDIIDDFQKLTVGKADIKIMIFKYKDETDWKDIINKCKNSVSKSLLNDGSKFILIGSSYHEPNIRHFELR